MCVARRVSRFLPALLLAGLLFSEAVAAVPGLPVAPTSAVAADTSGRKNVATGVLVAVAATVVPLTVGPWLAREGGAVGRLGATTTVLGFLVGPSAGNFYADDAGRGMIGAGLRLGGGLLFAGGVISALTTAWGGGDSSAAEALALGGALMVAGGTVWNVVTIPLSVREYNEDLPTLTVAPVLDARTRTAGLALAWRL